MADGSTPSKPKARSNGKHPGGRPPIYKAEFCQTVIELGKKGYSQARMAAHFGVAKQTIVDWSRTQPEFTDALARARAYSQNWWEHQAQLGLKDKNFNAPLWDKMVKSMFREDYDRPDRIEHTGKDGGAIETLDKDPGSAARKIAFMLGRAVGRQERKEDAEPKSA